MFVGHITVQLVHHVQVEGVSQSSATYGNLAVLMVLLCILFGVSWLAVVAYRMYSAARAANLKRPGPSPTPAQADSSRVESVNTIGRAGAQRLGGQDTTRPTGTPPPGGTSGSGTAQASAANRMAVPPFNVTRRDRVKRAGSEWVQTAATHDSEGLARLQPEDGPSRATTLAELQVGGLRVAGTSTGTDDSLPMQPQATVVVGAGTGSSSDSELAVVNPLFVRMHPTTGSRHGGGPQAGTSDVPTGTGKDSHA